MYKSLNLSFVLAYRALSSINEDVCNLKSTAIILAVGIILIKLEKYLMKILLKNCLTL